MRILAVSGESELLTSLEIQLAHQNFNVYGTDTGEEAIDLGKLYNYDAIVLSHVGDMHTDTVIRSLRTARVKTPILMLGHAGGAAGALDLGADDYMVTPFHIDEMTARLHAIVRRANGHAASKIEIGELVLNLTSKSVEYAGQAIHFTGKEFAMLELLLMRKGVTMTKEQIMSTLYGGMDEPELKIIDVFVCKLRRKLTNAGAPPNLIETVWGRGYLVRAESERVMLPPAVSNAVGGMTLQEEVGNSMGRRAGAM